MRTPLHAIVVSLLAGAVTAQEKAPEAKPNPNDPAVLLAQARPLIMQKKIDEAVVLLWRAIDQVAAQPAGAASSAAAGAANDTVAAARALLQGNDPCDAQRRTAFTAVGKQLVEMAAAYRGKKWFETAAMQLDVADRHDRDAGQKERAALDAALKSAKESRDKDAKPCPLLLRKSTRLMTGYWRESGECVEALQHTKEEPPYEWISNTSHKDNEVAIEFRPKEAGQPYAAGLWVGYTGDGDGTAGLRVVGYYDPPKNEYRLSIMHRRGSAWVDRGMMQVPARPAADGFHRMVVQVAGARIRARLDDSAVLEHTEDSAVRGDIGVSIGRGDVNSCAVFVRNLTMEPLPKECPVADATKSADEAAALKVAWTIDQAKELLGKKQPEPAARVLREAFVEVAAMSPGEPRTKAVKALDQLLAQADPLAAKAKKAAQAIGAELAKAADQYVSAGMPRAALQVVERAAGFDPEGQAQRLAAAREAAAK